MSERERPQQPGERPSTGGLGNPFPIGTDTDSTVGVEYGVYSEHLPFAGRTVGEIRRIVGSRYDIHPRADAFIDGNQVGHDVVVEPGQSVRFMHLSGEKGQGDPEEVRELVMASLFGDTPAPRRRIAVPRRKPPPTVTIEGTNVVVTTPEGRRATMELDELLTRLENRPGTNGDLVLPDGVKMVASRNGHIVLVHQTAPAIRTLRWIAEDSAIRHGEGTVYRQVRIALPYVIVLAVFDAMSNGTMRLSDRNECFFTTKPLGSPDDALLFPALLNCSKMGDPGKPLSWICTQFLERTPPPPDADLGECLRVGLTDILHCLFDTGFNYSSENYELSSWFTESTGADPRIKTIERWEEATRHDPMFVHGVRWIPVRRTVAEVIDRCLSLATGRSRSRTSQDIARIVRTRGEVDK